VSSEISITIFDKLVLECVVFTNLTPIQAIYSINNHHASIVVLEEASLKTGAEPFPETQCIIFQLI
jgi:hypothetical protein